MATSHSKRKRSKNKHRELLQDPRVDAVLTEAVKFLQNWTHKELYRLNRNGEVYILPGSSKNSYLVGKYKLIKHNEHCWTVIQDDQRVHDFYDRRAALFYCMSTQAGRHTARADEIRQLDGIVGKLISDSMHYTHSLDWAKRTKNWLLHDVVQARIIEISSKLEYHQEQLEKSLKWAKYNKTQDGSHETTRIRN